MTPARPLRRPTPLALLSLILVACSGGDSPTDPENEGDAFVLVWSDEFDGAAGTSPDPTKWTYDIGTGPNGDGWGNGQLEWNSDRPENVSMDGQGHLAITAREESFNGQNYTSARIKTQGLFAREYGRFEARIRQPVGRGLWPAFWMLGADIDVVGWPQTGEIDVMEYKGQEPDVLHGSLHGPGYSGGGAITRRVALDTRLDLDFHVYAVDWDPDRITWYFDGDAYFSVARDQVRARGEWVFDDPFFLILNVAVGGSFVRQPPLPEVDANFPQTMLVDYVRVYERAR
jgi:beta-glucanase (GH16 family)